MASSISSKAIFRKFESGTLHAHNPKFRISGSECLLDRILVCVLTIHFAKETGRSHMIFLAMDSMAYWGQLLSQVQTTQLGLSLKVLWAARSPTFMATLSTAS